jgi:hypothetical protein
MIASDQALTVAGSSQVATIPGRCVAMNATWNPQVKNPIVSRRKLRSAAAPRIASLSDVAPVCACGAAPEAPLVSQSTSGMARSPVAPSSIMAGCHPASPISSCANGTSVNWPNEPPALTMPLANERFASGIQRVAADSSIAGPSHRAARRENADQQDQSKRGGRERRVSAVASAMQSDAHDHHRAHAEAIRERAGDRLCATPHINCAIPNARLIVA